MSRSFHNKILRVNLSRGTIAVEEPDIAYLRRYMGGWNIIADVLLREVPAGADPLGPQNKLIFAPGVLTGLPFSGSSRNAVGAKSPLTGGFGTGDVGGHWPAEFKRSGFDAIIVEGVSPKPVYLWIKDGVAELRDAGHLWGKDTAETWEALQQETGDKRIRVAMIGPGGENMVRYACIMNETKDAAGRTGLGAVMGSKKLKVVVVRGTKPLEAANPEKIQELAQWMAKGVNAGEQAAWAHTYGTGAHIEDMLPTGNLPIRNFRDGEFPNAAEISANTILERVGTGMEGCWGCAVRCKKVVRIEASYQVDEIYGGPEYETIASLGSCCGVDDLAPLCKANALCNAYSLDTISTGVTIAFAMECFEKGLLTLEDTDGIELRFGNGAAVVAAIEKIARREGKLGALLAEGSLRAARAIGHGAERFAMQVKGQEFPMHEPRFKRGLAIGYAVSPTGADHCHALHDSGLGTPDEEGMMANRLLRSMGVLQPIPVESLGADKVRATLYNTIDQVTMNCLSVCTFVPWSTDQKIELLRAATGWDVSAFEMFKVGERALTLARAFNAREGFDIKDDTLPERSYGPTTNGALAQGGIDREELHEAVQTYYGMMGWDTQTGDPLIGTLQELDVAWAAEYLR